MILLAFDCSHSLMPPRRTESRKILSTIGDISIRTKWLVSKRYVQAAIVITLMTLAIAVPFFPRAFALTDVGNAGAFELDGNIVKNAATALPTDWGNNSTGATGLFDSTGATNPLPSGGLDAHWVNDGPHSMSDTTTFTTGSKDILDISANWACTPSSNITPKDDILHAYSYAAIAPTGTSRAGDLLVYGGFERFANNGAGDLGLWLLQDPTVSCSSSKGAVSFTGAHVVGDLLVVAEFSTGGSVTTINMFQWVGITKAPPLGVMNITNAGGADCTVAPSSANICARSNTAPISTLPWSTQDKTSGPNTLATAEFFELGIDLTGLFGSNAPCINRFIFDTRTSPSLTATLVDYAQGALVTCPTPAISTTVSPPIITLGGSAMDTATVTLTAGTVNGTVDFKVYGPFATNTPTCTGTPAASFLGVPVGPGPSPQTATSGSFTPLAPGYYFWTATYHPAGVANGSTKSTTCGDTGETLLVSSIPKITAFSFTNTPDNNDPTRGTGTVTYSVTIHNYGTSAVTLSGMLTVDGTASVTCPSGNPKTLSGSLPAGQDATFSLTCTYIGTSGQTVSATINAMFTDQNNVTGAVSGSPTTYTFTIQTT